MAVGERATGKVGIMHWEGEVGSAWEVVEGIGIVSKWDGEPFRGFQRGSGMTPAWDLGTVTALGSSQPKGNMRWTAWH